MSNKKRLDVYNDLIKHKLVPVFYNPEEEKATKMALACIDGGVGVLEWTNRGEHAIEVFANMQKALQEKYSDTLLGAGSIVDAPTAAAYINAGADFIVSPALDEEVALLCNKRKVAYIPGCATVTEIHRAHTLGVEIIKLFPGGIVGGPAFVKQILGPMPFTNIMPTGGVELSEASLQSWFSAGIVACGMGSKLFPKEAIDQGRFGDITSKVKEALGIIRQLN